MQSKENKITSEQKIVKAQLTLRAIVWDIQSKAVDTARLDQEIELFKICKIMLPNVTKGHKGTCCMQGISRDGVRYEKAVESLRQLGILEKEALLVTEDASMAKYAYERTSGSGISVVYYEEEDRCKEFSADMVVLGFEEVGVQFLDRIHKRRNHLPWNILYTQRTCVREITMADLDELYLLYEGEGITDYTEPLYERQKEEAYTKSYIDHMYYYYGYGMWIIRDRQTGALIGRAGLDHRNAGQEALVELGYIVGREYQNQGYATEVCQAIIKYARQELGIAKLHCFIHPDNKVSVHLAEKLGFQLDPDPAAGQGELLHYRKSMEMQ